MRANVLTISVPGTCKMNCPYCVSKMTYQVDENKYLFKENLPKVKALADRMGITHILITSKGEPMDNLDPLRAVLEIFYDYYVEIQTRLHDFNNDQLAIIARYSVDIIAVSIDHPIQLEDKKHWQNYNHFPWITRATIVLTKVFRGWTLLRFIDQCLILGFRQLTIRQPTVPKGIENTPEAKKIAEWIIKNTDPKLYQNILDRIDVMANSDDPNITYIRDLPFGADIWDIHGISFTAMRYCVESHNGEILRHLIYQADGHLYTTWDSRGSILF